MSPAPAVRQSPTGDLESTRSAMRSIKLPRRHPIDPWPQHDLAMLAVAHVAPVHAGTALPANVVARPPNRCDPVRDRCRPPGVALARLARLAAWQSLSARHGVVSLVPRCSRNIDYRRHDRAGGDPLTAMRSPPFLRSGVSGHVAETETPDVRPAFWASTTALFQGRSSLIGPSTVNSPESRSTTRRTKVRPAIARPFTKHTAARPTFFRSAAD